MAVAHDTFTNFSQGVTDTPNPMVVNHVPANTPRGVLVIVGQWLGSTDRVTGVTYGGVAMERVVAAFDTAGEPLAAYMYFLGSEIPTGTQEVAVTHNGTGGGGSIGGCVVSVTAAANTVIGASGIIQVDQANPQIALDTGSITSLRYAELMSGQDAPTGHTPVANTTGLAGGGFDISNQSGDWIYQTTPGSGSFTIGWTATSDDVAMVAVAIQEGSPATVTPAATAAPATIPASSAKGVGKSTPAATPLSFALAVITVKGGAVTAPAAVARVVVMDAVTAIGGGGDATVTPAATALAAAMSAAAVSGGAVVTLGASTFLVVLPQAQAKSPITASPATTARSVVLPAVTVQGSTVVETGISVTVVLPASTLAAGVVLEMDSIDMAAVASQVTIVLEGEDWQELTFYDEVW